MSAIPKAGAARVQSGCRSTRVVTWSECFQLVAGQLTVGRCFRPTFGVERPLSRRLAKPPNYVGSRSAHGSPHLRPLEAAVDPFTASAGRISPLSH
jgi:hypothetical protein